ncbi:MAG: TonB-dependent receptor [Saprospiraceae bacterium]|nr:TonB-dependent receptor [Saprospiraceae bacterium]
MNKILMCVGVMCLGSFGLYAQFQVNGRVTDAKDGSPLIGATLEETGTLNGTTTDFDGNFSIVLASGNARLTVSYVGYAMLTVEVSGRAIVDVVMAEDGVLLEQVVVVGYGVQKKSDVTGSISSLKGKEIEKVATSNIEQALQGKIAGVHVTPASGNPGAGAVIRIRGTGTLNNANPLYVIDGMITYDASLVNPQDVESIEVLKDASAAAIYGSRGANGVIIITTKNGRQKKSSQIGFASYYGTQTITKEIPMLSGQEFAKAYNQLRGQTYYPDPTIFGQGTNYQNEIFREAPIYNVQFSANGGSDLMTYNLSANYFKQDGVLKNTAFERGTFRLNTETKLNSWLSFGSNISYAISKNHNGPNVVTSAYRMPSVLAPYKEDGSYTDPTFFGLALANPLADQFYKSNNYGNGERLFGNLYMEASLLKNFKFRSNFGFDRARDKSRYFEPKFEVSASQRNLYDRLSVGQSAGNNWIWEQTLTYTKDFGNDHSLTVLAGYTAEERTSEWIGGSRENFPGTADELLYLSSGNDTTQMNYGRTVDEALVSQLFRLNYAYKSRYFVTASLRRDQSSRFTEVNRTGYFPSMSLGWNIGREGFVTDLDIFTDLKARFSYGILGNQASASTYPSAGVVSSGLYAVFGSSESLSQGATLLSLSNPNLHWETSRQADIGLDGSFFDGKLSFEIDWYNRLTYDIISAVPIPDYIGSQTNPVVNTAEVLNTGWDIGLRYNKAGDFGYSFGANISPVKNEVTKLAQGKNEIFAAFLQGEPATHTEVGLPIGSFYGYKVEGIFQNEEEIAGSPNIGGEKPGDLRFADTDNNGIIDGDDRVFLGSPIPTLTYGFSAGCDYKGFDLAIDFLGVHGNKVYNAKETFRFGVYNWEKNVAEAWTVDNPSTTEPRVTNGGHNYRVSDRFLQDGSFFRLRNVSIGYTLLQTICNKMRLQSFRVYLGGNNLWTKQSFSGYSPEFANSGNPFEVGIDFGNYPIAKSTQLGIDLKF